jgi:hypothetical protein
MKLRIVVILILFSFMLFNIYSIAKKSYENLTDKDRILLSISFYEVAQKYQKLGKNILAKQYFEEAFKIEKNVEKYIKGELDIPEKKIQIDLKSFSSGEGENNSEEQQVSIEKENINKMHYLEINNNFDNFIMALIDKDVNKAVSFFSNNIMLEGNSISISKTELEETIKGWIDKENIHIPRYITEISNLGENNFKVKIIFLENFNFFIGLNNNSINLYCSGEKNKYLFSKISSSLINKISENAEIISSQINSPQDIIINFIDSILKNDYNGSINYFNKDVWFSEFNILISKDKIKEVFIDWKKNIKNINKVSDVIDLDSLKEYADNDNKLFDEWGVDLKDFYKIEVFFKSIPIFPGNSDSNKYLFIIDKINDNDYKIVAVSPL